MTTGQTTAEARRPDPPDAAAGDDDPGAAAASAATGQTRARPHGSESSGRLSLAVYSDDVDTRAAVRRAVGRRPAADLPLVAWTEVATFPALRAAVDRYAFDLLVLDGEATPVGGMGACRQLKDEVYQCPPVLVLTGRPQDAWLAAWSRADAAVPHPLDPRALAAAVADLARLALSER